MKNKIILLTLVLLIPSLCFGKSLRIDSFCFQENFRIDFLDSTIAPNVYVEFPILADKKWILMSEDSYKFFRKLLIFHFEPSIVDKIFEKYHFKMDKRMLIGIIQQAIVELAVMCNYSITFKEHNSITQSSTVFLYKPEN